VIDIGINLTHDSFHPDRDALVAAARAVGVVGMVVTGTSLESSAQAIALARARPGRMWCTAGVHPHHAADWDGASAARLRQLLAEPEVVAVGECGLDLFRNLAPEAAQERAFHAQLELATTTRKPAFLHQRAAHARCLAILREHAIGHGVAHCFTEGPAEAADYLALGLHLGITGWLCDERRGAALREAVPMVPSDRLLIETDAPYLLPRTLQPRPKTNRNEPRHLVEVLEQLAALRGEDPAEVAAYTTANACALFGIALSP
jgi:TatD DNase family protein